MYDETVVIYSDLLFFVNFSLDYLCLFITGRILNCAGSTKRLLIASILGGLYAFVPYIFELAVYISLPLHIITVFGMCFVAFGKRDAKKFFMIAGTFIVTSALMGGLVTAFYSLSSQYSNGVYTEVDALSFCLICAFSALVALSYGLICRKKIHIRSAEIRIYAGNEKISARLLCDSGNLVTEPFSALPVIVISSSCLPPPIDTPESELFPFPIRAIPFSTSAGKSCFLGFRPDKIEILQPPRKPKRVDAFIGIDTDHKSYSGYDGLLPTSIL